MNWFLACIVCLVCVSAQNVVVEYLKQAGGCSDQPVRLYTLSQTCVRGPISFRYSYSSCNTTVSTGTWRNCAAQCLDPNFCTSLTYTLGNCNQNALSPSGRSGPYKYTCGPISSITPPINMTIQLNYTEYQETFCQNELQSYQQLRVGCVDNEFWQCSSTGVLYRRYTGDSCQGDKVAEQTYTYGTCAIINGRYYKIWGCNAPPTRPTNSGASVFSHGTWLAALGLSILSTWGLY